MDQEHRVADGISSYLNVPYSKNFSNDVQRTLDIYTPVSEVGTEKIPGF
tara:strand:+ start:1559 stop:1705 length:147 start_codon:yes stop_codon:yes gene_type:complete